MRAEVKQLALDQLATGGPQALSINSIAKALGVSGPALYRYFRSRDDLLTELILDAYTDLAAAMGAADDLTAMVAAYRGWAIAQPHRYRLLFAAPLPGYDAHDERLVAASQQVMEAVLRQTDQVTAITLWSRLHGLASLEIEGNFASMGVDPGPFYSAVF